MNALEIKKKTKIQTFQAPVPPQNWTETLDCSQQCEPCYHFDRRLQKIVGCEDSLKINVFAKEVSWILKLKNHMFLCGNFSRSTLQSRFR